jgi:hypothetical protein
MEPIRDTTDSTINHRVFLEFYDLADPRDRTSASDVSAKAWLATVDLFIARMYQRN